MVIAGIDIGGTFIKGGLVGENGEILYNGSVQTDCTERGLVDSVCKLISKMLREKGIERSGLAGIGMGIPGMIDGEAGCVRYANNLNLKDFYIVAELKKHFDLPIRITNDANAAALGEAKFGAGRGRRSMILLTLGTGVGGGIVLDGKVFEGNGGAGAELGHSVIRMNGEPCTCGRKGCLEAYASATALIRDTKRAMRAHPESSMWTEVSDLEQVDGKTAFSQSESDPAAAEVVKNYIEALGVGLVNYANVFRPEIILLGGGISKEGSRLTDPLQKFVDENVYAGSIGPRVEIGTASLGNRAGLAGAAALLLNA